MTSSTSGYDQHPFFAQIYDHLPVYKNRNDLTFYKTMVQKFGDPILELGCGTGRLMIPLAREGYRITGLDLSDNMLNVLKQNLAKEPEEVCERITFVKGDMSDSDLSSKYNLITIPFRAFQILTTTKQQLSCLAAVRKHISDDGRLILDLFNPDIQLLLLDKDTQIKRFHHEFSLPDGTQVVRKAFNRNVDFNSQIMDSDLVHEIEYSDGSKEELVQKLKIRYLFRYEAEHLLVRSGFDVEDVFADFKFTPFGEKYPSELIIVAHKQS